MIKKSFILGIALIAGTLIVPAQDFTMTSNNISGEQGTTAVIEVNLTNTLAIRDMQMFLELPLGVTVPTDEYDDYCIDINTARNPKHSVTCNYDEGLYKMAIASISAKEIKAGEGAVAYITIDLSAAPGVYNYSFSNVHLSRVDEENMGIDVEMPDFGGTITITSSGTPPLTSYDLVDGTSYTNTTDYEGIDVTYTRTFNNTEWQALYIPFEIKYEEWSSIAQIAELAGVHQYDDNDDGVIDRTTIEFITVKSGKINPHIPYVIKSKQATQVVLTANNTLLKGTPAEDGYVECSSPRWQYKLIGTYVPRTDLTNGERVLGGGKFGINTGTVKPFRFYLTSEKKEGGYWEKAGQEDSAMEIELMVDGEEISGIDILNSDLISIDSDDNYYNLSGQLIKHPTEGIYIHKGKIIYIH